MEPSDIKYNVIVKIRCDVAPTGSILLLGKKTPEGEVIEIDTGLAMEYVKSIIVPWATAGNEFSE